MTKTEAAAAVRSAENTWKAVQKGDRQKMAKRDARNAAVAVFMEITGETDMIRALDDALALTSGQQN